MEKPGTTLSSQVPLLTDNYFQVFSGILLAFNSRSLEQPFLVLPCVMPPGEKRSEEEELTADRRSPENSSTVAFILGPGRQVEKALQEKGKMGMASSGNVGRPFNLNVAVGLGELFLSLPAL